VSLSPARGWHPPILNLQSSSDSELLEDWPEANDMVASIYVALTTDASSSCALTASSLRAAENLMLASHLLDDLVHERLHQ
jgi:hypothetical protein